MKEVVELSYEILTQIMEFEKKLPSSGLLDTNKKLGQEAKISKTKCANTYNPQIRE
jgi:uncharacterized protein YjgD (DUF1641 family)